MRRLLLILTRPDDPLSARMAHLQSEHRDCEVETADLTRGEPDYDQLLDQIFAADSVQLW